VSKASLSQSDRKKVISLFTPPRSVITSTAITTGEGFSELLRQQCSSEAHSLAVFYVALTAIGRGRVIGEVNQEYFGGRQPTLPPLSQEESFRCLLLRLVVNLAAKELRSVVVSVAGGANADHLVLDENIWEFLYLVFGKLKTAKTVTVKAIVDALKPTAEFDNDLKEILDALLTYQ